jgi:hypothetical protein
VRIDTSQLKDIPRTSADGSITQEVDATEIITGATEFSVEQMITSSFMKKYVSKILAYAKQHMVLVFSIMLGLVLVIVGILQTLPKAPDTQPPTNLIESDGVNPSPTNRTISSVAQSRKVTLAHLEEIADRARETGQWKDAQLALDKAEIEEILLPEDKRTRLYQQITAWYNFWIGSQRRAFAPETVFAKLEKAFDELNAVAPPQAIIPDVTESSTLRADKISATLYTWQEQLAQHIFLRRDQLLSAIPESPSETTIQARETLRDQIAILISQQHMPWTQHHNFDSFWETTLNAVRTLESQQSHNATIDREDTE